MGLIPEEIVRKFGHLSLARFMRPLPITKPIRQRSTRTSKLKALEAEALERQHGR